MLWEFVSIPIPEQNTIDGAVPQPSSDHEPSTGVENVIDADGTKHTLPFKVLGTCCSKERQDVLEQAYEWMEHNRPVYVDLRHEPENPYDENAIAVYLQNDDIFKHVGYIARELTQYVRPCLNEPGFNAQVKNIRFRTTLQLNLQNMDCGILMLSKQVNQLDKYLYISGNIWLMQ